MTLGGLALAVGILVDDATVAIENINWHLEQGKDVETAIIDGAAQIATPAFVSMLCICIVFVPMFFLQGVARFLFVPMAEAVVFAMAARSCCRARWCRRWRSTCCARTHRTRRQVRTPRRVAQSAGRASSAASSAASSGCATATAACSRWRCARRWRFVGRLHGVRRWLSFALVPLLGRNFFPTVDAGQILLHVRVPGRHAHRGDRRSASRAIQQAIREIIPPDEIDTMVDNIGLPTSEHQPDLQQHRRDRLRRTATS